MTTGRRGRGRVVDRLRPMHRGSSTGGWARHRGRRDGRPRGGDSPCRGGRSHRVAASAPAAVRGAPSGRRKRSTASTRRCSLPVSGSPSLVKIVVTCFCTLRSGDVEAVGDRLVRAALGDQLEHLALARRERAERAVLACAVASRPRDDLRVERRAAVGHAPSASTKSAEVGHAVLEQVAEPLGASASSRVAMPTSTCCGEDHDRPRPGGARGSLRGLQPLVGVGRRHPDVDDRDVGRVLVDRREQLVGGRRLGDDLDPRVAAAARRCPRARSRLSSAITTRTAAPR